MACLRRSLWLDSARDKLTLLGVGRQGKRLVSARFQAVTPSRRDNTSIHATRWIARHPWALLRFQRQPPRGRPWPSPGGHRRNNRASQPHRNRPTRAARIATPDAKPGLCAASRDGDWSPAASTPTSSGHPFNGLRHRNPNRRPCL